jgi:endonuclease/exonuclease/phosphatase family metal-dependent hydrolase
MRQWFVFAYVLTVVCACADDDAAPPAPAAAQDLTVANLNILHGITCPPLTNFCRRAERIDLLFQWIRRAGCPDVVTLQEVWNSSVPLLTAQFGGTCPFTYESVYMRTTIGTDDEMLLSRYPVRTWEVQPLFRGFRSVLWARVDHPIGPVDVFSTHLASSSDAAEAPCEAPACPPECVAAGAANTRECQAVQLARFVETRHDGSPPAIISGDFNESPGSFVYDQFVHRGWIDAYLAAGNPECDPATGVGCTSGREDTMLTELESPARHENERIDFIFVVPSAVGSACAASIDSATDADGDGVATGVFAGDPNPFVVQCGAAPLQVCWPSDHAGVQLDLNCR